MIRDELVRILSSHDARNALFGMPGTRHFPVEWQLVHLGLDKGKIKEMQGKNVLDLGCGNGDLVKYLIEQEIKAEGISPEAPEGDYFMRQKVTSIHPHKGSIPRPDESYDVVLSNSNNVLCMAFSSHAEAERKTAIEYFLGNPRGLAKFNKEVQSMGVEAHLMMMEILRVMKRKGEFICSPYLDKLQEKMAFELSNSNYKIVKEPNEFALALEERIRADETAKRVMQLMTHTPNEVVLPDYLKHRLIIYKGK